MFLISFQTCTSSEANLFEPGKSRDRFPDKQPQVTKQLQLNDFHSLAEAQQSAVDGY